MSKHENISMSVIRRLPRYYRFLSDCIDKNITKISSKELAERMGLTASQIRQDLNCFGGFGQQGYGYSVEYLKNEIGSILGLQNNFKAILIGAGNLGNAVASQLSFNKLGFDLIGIFDSSEQLIGKKINNIDIFHIDSLELFCKTNKPVMAILCVPKSSAKSITDKLYSIGIRSFWNFSHYDINLNYNEVTVENVHMSDSLMTLCYKINKNLNI